MLPDKLFETVARSSCCKKLGKLLKKDKLGNLKKTAETQQKSHIFVAQYRIGNLKNAAELPNLTETAEPAGYRKMPEAPEPYTSCWKTAKPAGSRRMPEARS
jgi:hypothetical protein